MVETDDKSQRGSKCTQFARKIDIERPSQLDLGQLIPFGETVLFQSAPSWNFLYIPKKYINEASQLRRVWASDHEMEVPLSLEEFTSNFDRATAHDVCAGHWRFSTRRTLAVFAK